LDDSVKLDEYGYVVAADALAQMIFSPIFGYICDHLGSIRIVSLTSSVIFSLGHLFYSSIALIPKSVGSIIQARFYAIMVARFLVGIGTGKKIILKRFLQF
jgi:MFS family permease